MRKFEYYINNDERGEFYADVRDDNGNTVLDIHGFEIFEYGDMRDKNDIDGLSDHMARLGLLPEDAYIVKGN